MTCIRHPHSHFTGRCPYCWINEVMGYEPVYQPAPMRPLWTYMTLGDAVIIGMLTGVLLLLGYAMVCL